MGVFAPPQRRPILTDLDKKLLMQLLRQSQTSQESYIRESALGVPWGSLANSLVGGMLVGRERRRQEEKIERSDAYADRAAEIMSMGTDLVPGQVSISPEGTFETLPTDVQGGGVSTFTRPETYGETLKNYKSSGIAEDQLFEQGIPVEDQLAAQFARDNLNKLTGRRVPGVEATTYSPKGIPYAPQPETLTVGEEFPEDSTRLGRWYSGARPQEELSTDANVALSQALRGAGYDTFETQEYMRNRQLEEQKRLRELQPQFKTQKTYYTSKGEPTIVNMFIDPKTGLPLYRGEFNEPIDISPLSPDKPDIEANVLQLNAEQFNEANTILGLDYPEGSVVKLKLEKGFNPEGKTIQELYENATSIDWKEPKKPDIQNIYTGDIPKKLNDKLRDNIQNSIGVIGQGASLIEKIANIPDAVGIKGRIIRSAAGVAGLIDSVAETDLESALTQYWAGADPEELSRVTADIRQYVAKSITTITGEESGRYTEPERDLAKETIAAEAALGTPRAVYGALISILSIEERSRDRATTAIARNKARISGEPIEYTNPLLNDEQKISYMKYLQKLGFDKKSAINVIEGIELDREIADRGGI